MSNMIPVSHDEARPEVDDLLRDYFQAEMPKSWPAFKAPRPARMKRSESLWSRYSGRLALAACVALLVGGYLTLSGYFPAPTISNGIEDATRPAAIRDKKAKQTPKPKADNQDDQVVPMGNDGTRRLK